MEELVEAMKLFDNDKDGKLLVPELRWAMTRLGEMMDESIVDEMIKEIDPEKKGIIDILEFSKHCFNIKDKPPAVATGKKDDKGKGTKGKKK